MANEKRLIDAEALKVEIERYADAEETASIIRTGGAVMSWEHRQVMQAALALKCALKIVDDAPAVDAVWVVRCKDCKFWEKQKDSAQGRCLLSGNYPTGGWYCADARRRCEDG